MENKTVPENPPEDITPINIGDAESIEAPTAEARADELLDHNGSMPERFPKSAAVIDSRALIQAAKEAGLDSLLPPEENPQTVPLPDVEWAYENLDAPGSPPQPVRRFVSLLRTLALRNIEVVRKYGSRLATTLSRWAAQGLTRLEHLLRRSDAAVIVFTLAMAVGCVALTLLAVWIWNTY